MILAIDLREKKDKIRKFIAKEKLPFPVLLDREGDISNHYGVRGVPTHFIIDGRGMVVGMAVGARFWDNAESRDLFQRLIARYQLK